MLHGSRGIRKAQSAGRKGKHDLRCAQNAMRHVPSPPDRRRQKRNSDIYIFCILDHKDKQTVDPLNLDQWKFYLLETSKLDEKLKNQKTLTLSGLLKLNPLACTFLEIKAAVERNF
jgi:hypothetical protein